MAVQLSELVVALKANTGAFSAKMKGASAVTSSFHSRVREGIGTAAKYGAVMTGVVAAGLTVYTKRSLEAIDVASKLATRMGMTVETLMGFRFAAEIMGASAEQMDKTLQDMNQRLGEAAVKGGMAGEALKALGLDINKLIGMDAGEQFLTIADAISQVKTASETGYLGKDILGKSVTKQMLGLLQHQDQVVDLIAEYSRLRGVVTAVDFGMVAQALDDIGRAKAAVAGISDEFAIRLAPAISIVATKIASFFSASEGRTAGINTGVDSLISSFATLGHYLDGIANSVARLVDDVPAIGKSVGTLRTAGNYGAKALAALFSPPPDTVGLSKEAEELIREAAMQPNNPLAVAAVARMDDKSKYVTGLSKKSYGDQVLEKIEAQRKILEEQAAEEEKLAKTKRAEAVQEMAENAIREQTRAVIESLATPLDKYNEKVAELNALHKQLTPEQFAAAMAKAREEYEAADPAVQALTSSMAALAAQGEALADSLATPGEAFHKKLADYREMLDAGAITPETYQRAVADAQKDLAAMNDTQQDLTDGATDYASALDEVARAAEAARAAAEGTTFSMRRAGTGGPASSGIAGGYAAMGLPGATSGIGSYGMGGGAGYSGGGAAAVPNGPSRDGGQWQQVIALLRQIASNTGAPGMAFVG